MHLISTIMTVIAWRFGNVIGWNRENEQPAT
jgi:hypothetical protein